MACQRRKPSIAEDLRGMRRCECAFANFLLTGNLVMANGKWSLEYVVVVMVVVVVIIIVLIMINESGLIKTYENPK